MKLTGRRGSISIDTSTSPRTATKSAQPGMGAAIQKEASILQILTEAGIDFVPQIIDQGDHRFRYHWIDGSFFHLVYAQSTEMQKKQLATQLIDHAYALDRCWIVHGELDDPRTNLLVDDQHKLWILDFERGWCGDRSGKNLRHIAQRLYRSGYIDLQILQSLGWYSLDALYKQLLSAIDGYTKHSASFGHHLVFILILVVIDLGSKRLFYDRARWASTWLLTPVLNTGIWRSIPVPLPRVIGLTIIVVSFLFYGVRKRLLPTGVSVFILAGALGNLIDRIRLWGVRDFIDLHIWPVFNAADIFLSIGAILLLVMEIRHYMNKQWTSTLS